MGKSMVYIVSDDIRFVENCTRFVTTYGVSAVSFTEHQWNLAQKTGQMPASPLPAPQMHFGEDSNVISLNERRPSAGDRSRGVPKMTDLESEAIRNAIAQFKGNLTEVASALGIGRATLYRKIKHYNIDPSEARKSRYFKAS